MSSIPLEQNSSHIAKHCGESAPEVAVIYDAASKHIQVGGIAIGEDHFEPHARALVLDLIDAGLVKHLYLEMPDLDTPEYGDKMTLGLYLRQLAAEKRDVTQDGNWKFISDILTFAARKNEVTLAQIAARAVPKGVNLYLWDEDPVKNSASAEGMKRRNLRLKAKPGESTIGSRKNEAVLTGGEHLRGHQCGAPENTIQALCGIAQNAVFDLGNYSNKKK